MACGRPRSSFCFIGSALAYSKGDSIPSIGASMDNRAAGFLLIVTGVIALTAAQILIKSRFSHHGAVPLNMAEAWPYLLGLMADWTMWVGLLGLVVSSFLWYAAISRLPLSLAYPFAALSYPLIFGASLLFLRENFTWQALGGNVLIVLGVLLVAGASS